MNLISYEEFCDRVWRIRKANHMPILKCYECGSTQSVVGDFYKIYEQYYVSKCARCHSQKYLTAFKLALRQGGYGHWVPTK